MRKRTPEGPSSFYARLRDFRSPERRDERKRLRELSRWNYELYSFGKEYGIETRRSSTTFAIRDEMLSLSSTIKEHVHEPATEETFDSEREPYYRKTYQAYVANAPKSMQIQGFNIELTALSTYDDFRLPLSRFNTFMGDFQNGIVIHYTYKGMPMSFEIGNNTLESYVTHTSPNKGEQRFYPNIFPVPSNGFPNRLGEHYPKLPDGKREMVKDIAYRSAYELRLTSRAHAIVEKAFGINLEPPTEVDRLLKQWEKTFQDANNPKTWAASLIRDANKSTT